MSESEDILAFIVEERPVHRVSMTVQLSRDIMARGGLGRSPDEVFDMEAELAAAEARERIARRRLRRRE